MQITLDILATTAPEARPQPRAARRFFDILPHAEAEKLSPEDFNAYCDWLFSRNEAICRRRETGIIPATSPEHPGYLNGDYAMIGPRRAHEWGA